MDQRIDLEIGDRVRLEMPWSGVCEHMKVHGQVLEVEIREHGAQLYKDGRPFSFPILWGEAGIYTDHQTKKPFTYNAERVEV
ncbi:hypothetical protein [Streptomyces noursei]|uniref:Uncharacterized protein n=1 Tax=Streptomyces noursei TaxID=1971 RepID=A0A2N8PQS7_STRNR|nr:hypothetical protein [Streptomyces noursei]PNE43380.1 hypothetical protein AOB60_00070 [Streptomyces noursei]